MKTSLWGELRSALHAPNFDPIQMLLPILEQWPEPYMEDDGLRDYLAGFSHKWSPKQARPNIVLLHRWLTGQHMGLLKLALIDQPDLFDAIETHTPTYMTYLCTLARPNHDYDTCDDRGELIVGDDFDDMEGLFIVNWLVEHATRFSKKALAQLYINAPKQDTFPVLILDGLSPWPGAPVAPKLHLCGNIGSIELLLDYHDLKWHELELVSLLEIIWQIQQSTDIIMDFYLELSDGSWHDSTRLKALFNLYEQLRTPLQ